MHHPAMLVDILVADVEALGRLVPAARLENAQACGTVHDVDHRFAHGLVEVVRFASVVKAIGLVDVEQEPTAHGRMLSAARQASLHGRSVEQAEQARIRDQDSVELSPEVEASHVCGVSLEASSARVGGQLASCELEQPRMIVEARDGHPSAHQWSRDSTEPDTEFEHLARLSAFLQVEVDVARIAAMQQGVEAGIKKVTRSREGHGGGWETEHLPIARPEAVPGGRREVGTSLVVRGKIVAAQSWRAVCYPMPGLGDLPVEVGRAWSERAKPGHSRPVFGQKWDKDRD